VEEVKAVFFMEKSGRWRVEGEKKGEKAKCDKAGVLWVAR
jgi:hypothetical protein